MNSFSTTKLSTKGQIVIPEEIRLQMGLEPGARFIVMAEDDVVVLKTITVPSKKDMSALVKRARKEAARVGMKQSDIKQAIAESRKKS